MNARIRQESRAARTLTSPGHTGWPPQLRPALQMLASAACIAAAGAAKRVLAAASEASSGSSKVGGDDRSLATFAGGCFWCMEAPFEKVAGVIEVQAGYTGGRVADPSYRQVSAGETDHAEAVQIVFAPSKVSYADLVEIFWRQIDPTDAGGQFADRGTHYRTAIFYHDEDQRRIALGAKRRLELSGKFEEAIATEVEPAGPFLAAEDYHQDYYKKKPTRYQRYREGSGRAAYLQRTWAGRSEPRRDLGKGRTVFSKPTTTVLKERLEPLRHRVTQEEGTEPPFRNELWANKAAGIYVDAVSGEPLFSSSDKFASGTGWPSFTRPLVDGNVIWRLDTNHGMERIEVRSRHGGSHLGHVFTDGPAPTGLRYCINSAALRFVPFSDLVNEGYGGYEARLRASRAD